LSPDVIIILTLKCIKVTALPQTPQLDSRGPTSKKERPLLREEGRKKKKWKGE